MRAWGVVMVLLALALPVQAQPVPTSEAELAEALQGCWTRKSWSAEIEAQRADPDFHVSSQMCLAGGLDGELHDFRCEGHSSDDCREILATYAFRDGRFWRDYGVDAVGGGLVTCNASLEGGRWLTLSDCRSMGGDAAPLEDVAYERLVEL
jgi:hypothetical protein